MRLKKSGVFAKGLSFPPPSGHLLLELSIPFALGNTFLIWKNYIFVDMLN